MGKLLEKALKDAVKEGKCVLGAKQVLGFVGGSKLIVVSRHAGARLPGIEGGARDAGVPVVRFSGTSVALGRLCGLQFRVSAASITSATQASIKSITSETENE